MKIGIDCRLINKIQNTGISRYTEFLIQYYISRYGAENIVLITNDGTFNSDGCEVVCTSLKPYNILHFFRFSSFVEGIGLDLLHVPFYSAFFKNNSSIKVVVTVHDLMYRFVKNFFGKNNLFNRFKIRYFDFIVKRSLINADRIVTVSETTKRDVLETYGLDSVHIPEDSCLEGNGDFSILKKYNLAPKGFYFYCGNNRPHKNVNFIVDIFKNNRNLPPLVLAGKGHQSCENVIVTGIVSEEELRALYTSAIAFVFPSQYEGFGLPVLEALRLRTFVLASKTPAFLEFQSQNILYFKLNDKEEFLEAISQLSIRQFVSEDDFFDYYDKDRIYKLNDLMLNDLLND